MFIDRQYISNNAVSAYVFIVLWLFRVRQVLGILCHLCAEQFELVGGGQHFCMYFHDEHITT